MGKTKQQLIQIFVPPSSTQQSTGSPEEFWYYENLTYDTTTNRANDLTQVVIENGVVTRINF